MNEREDTYRIKKVKDLRSRDAEQAEPGQIVQDKAERMPKDEAAASVVDDEEEEVPDKSALDSFGGGNPEDSVVDFFE